MRHTIKLTRSDAVQVHDAAGRVSLSLIVGGRQLIAEMTPDAAQAAGIALEIGARMAQRESAGAALAAPAAPTRGGWLK